MDRIDRQQEPRWAGRDERKDPIRTEIWDALQQSGAAVGQVVSQIPNFVGADRAADRLAALPIWKSASVVKSNPDPPQAPVRLRALQDGKKVYTPVPELTEGFPFVELDPSDLRQRGLAFEDVQFSEDFIRLGRPVQFEEMDPLDLVVVGCVAVTHNGARTGKGGGFADLELGIFRELGLVNPDTPIVTTVHPIQVVDDEKLVMQRHDSALHWIVTPDEVINAHSAYPQPEGVYWDQILADQYRDIPFLTDLRDRFGSDCVAPGRGENPDFSDS